MLAPAILPELFDSVSIAETDIEEESATISYALSHQYDLEDVMDKFEDQMELTILYHFIPLLILISDTSAVLTQTHSSATCSRYMPARMLLVRSRL